MREFNVDFMDLCETLRDAHVEERVYIDGIHVNHRGYRAITHRLFNEYIREILGPDNEAGLDEALPHTFRDLSLPPLWLDLNERGKSLHEFFDEVGARRVALLGEDLYGDVMTQLLVDFKGGVFETVCVLCSLQDERFSRLRSVAVMSKEEISEELGLDFIVSIEDPGLEVINDLEKRSGAQVILLDELISILYDRYFVISSIAESLDVSKYPVCLLGWPRARDVGNTDLRFSGAVSADLLKEPGRLVQLYGDLPGYSTTDPVVLLKELFAEMPMIEQEGALMAADVSGRFVNVKDGCRLTSAQSIDCSHFLHIHLFGGNPAFGVGADDRHTISNFLQERINSRGTPGALTACQVVNHGLKSFGRKIGSEEIAGRILYEVNHERVAFGDIVLCILPTFFHEKKKRNQGVFTHYIKKYISNLGVEYVDLAQVLGVTEMNSGAYIDDENVNHRGYKAAATKIYFDFVKVILDRLGTH
jgi:hypothetical protein